MLYYNKIDVSEGIDVILKQVNQMSLIIVTVGLFLGKGFKF